MANRIIVATLYQAGTGANAVSLLNVSPRSLVVNHSEDDVYLMVKLDESVTKPASNPTTVSCQITWAKNCQNPFSGSGPGISNVTSINTATLLGSLENTNSKVTAHYTLTVVYNGQTFSEDPQLKISQGVD